MPRTRLSLAVLALALGTPLAAQTTGTPVFLAPYRAFDRVEFGGSLSDPGSGWALEGFYRFGAQRYDFGFRGGFADADNAETVFLAGVDFRTRVVDHSEEFPLDGAFTVGLGAAFGDGETVARLPVGISLGRRVLLEDSDVEFVPYIHPVLTPIFGDTGPDDGDIDFALGLGVDIRLTRRFDLRVSGALGDIEGLAVSFAFLR
jgi:hypothetical protein